MKTLRLFLAVALFTSLSLNNCSLLSAGFYLTGAQIYSAAANGGLTSPTDTYRHSTNSTDTVASTLSVAVGTNIPNINPVSAGISLQLLTNTDSTTFSFRTGDLFSSPGNYVGINLFFSDTADSYNPSNDNIGGHLTVATTVSNSLSEATGDFLVVPKTTTEGLPVLVQNYAFHGASNSTKPQANGLALFDVGGGTVEVSSFKATFASGSGVQGQFTIKVVATPEPTTLGLGAIACFSVIGFARKASRRIKS